MFRRIPIALLLSIGALSACGEDQPTVKETGEEEPPVETDDAGDDMASAEALVFNEEDGSTSWSDELNPAGDRDWFFVQPSVGAMMLFYTVAYIADGDADPDTVIRVYDSTGTLLTENDDMPYRFWETDSGIFWQATDAAGYYVEVLEWADWAGEAAVGGAGWDYELFGFAWGVPEYEEFNDSPEDAYAAVEAEEASFFYSTTFGDYEFSSYSSSFFGEIDEPGDVDYLPMEITDDYLEDGGIFYCFSFWPTNLQSLAPLMTLYDEDMNVIAQTTEPDYTPNWYRIYDSGICRYIDQAGRYTLAIEDADGNGGVGEGYFYPGLSSAYIEAVAPPEEEQNDEPSGANLLEMTNSSSSPDFWYGGFNGTLEVPSDSMDVFGIVPTDVGGFSGTYLTVSLSTARFGSLLDAELIVYQDDGTGNLEELARSSTDPSGDWADDPAIWDLELSTEGTLYFVVTREDAAAPAPSHFYMGYVYLDSEPSH